MKITINVARSRRGRAAGARRKRYNQEETSMDNLGRVSAAWRKPATSRCARKATSIAGGPSAADYLSRAVSDLFLKDSDARQWIFSPYGKDSSRAAAKAMAAPTR
jgi:hypothetical protein